MIRPLFRVAACTMLASVLAAQTPAVAEVLSGFDNHRLPALLQQLHTPQHEQAVKELAKLGDSAHRYLLGKLRLPGTTEKEFSAAFGGFGPQCAWAMPALLERASSTYLSRTHWRLLVKLGPTARPAIPLLAKLHHQPKEFRQIQIAAETGAKQLPAARALPSAALNARWRTPLLTILEDAEQHEQWWQAVQGLLAIDDEASVAACSVLLGYVFNEHPTHRQQASNLLHAIQCYYAANALRDLETSSLLPASVRTQQMLRTVLANCHQLAKPYDRRPNLTTEHIPASLLTSDLASDQRICALSAALHAAMHPDIVQDPTRIAQWSQSSDPQTAHFARLASTGASERDTAWIHTPFAKFDHHTLKMIRGLSPAVATQIPIERLREALAIIPKPAKAQSQPRTSEDIATQILTNSNADRNRQTNSASTGQAKSVLAAIANRAPKLVLEHELARAERQQITHALIRYDGPADPLNEQLHDFVIDNLSLEKPEKSYTITYTLPVALAPTVIARLKNRKQIDHTLRVLLAHWRLLDWAQAIDRQAEAVAAALPLLEPSQYQTFADLFRHGNACRRQAERMMLNASTPAELRTLLARSGGNSQFPPSPEFVLQALTSEQKSLRSCGIGAARHVTSRKQDVSKALRAIYPVGDEQTDPFLIGQIGSLQQPCDRAWLEQQIPKTDGMLRIAACLAVLGFDGDATAATKQIKADLAAADGKVARRIWSWLSHSEAGSAAFLEHAMEHLAKADDFQNAFRLCRLLKQATVRRGNDAMAALQSLSGCGLPQLEQQAAQTLQQIGRDRKKR